MRILDKIYKKNKLRLIQDLINTANGINSTDSDNDSDSDKTLTSI